MTSNKHPITLERVVFTRSVVIAIPEYSAGIPVKLDIGPENDINVVPIEDQEGRYQASMSSKLNIKGDAAYPYIIDMECVGVFHADKELSQEEAMRGVMITAHAVLYGAIREAVAWITGRQPFGQIMLGLSVLRPAQKEKVK